MLDKTEDADNKQGEEANNLATNIANDLKKLEKEISKTKDKIAELKN